MIVTIKIPDEVYEVYRSYKPNDPELAITQTVQRFASTSPSDRILIVPSKQRQELEMTLGTTFSHAKELVEKVRQLSSLHVQGIQVSIDPDTLARLKEQAEFEGVTSPEFLEQKVREGVDFVIFGG